MTFKALRISAVAALLVTTSAQAQQDWVTVTDHALRFAAPVQPTSSSQSSTDEGVNYTTTLYVAVIPGRFEVVASRSVYQPGPGKPDAQVAMGGVLKGLKATPISEADAPYTRGPNDVLPGRYDTAQNDHLNCHIRSVVDDEIIYLMAACGVIGQDTTADMDRAMASFTILPN